MVRYRLSAPAWADIASILRTSETRYGFEARFRYRGLLTAAMRRIAAGPEYIEIVRVLHDRMEPGRHMESQI